MDANGYMRANFSRKYLVDVLLGKDYLMSKWGRRKLPEDPLLGITLESWKTFGVSEALLKMPELLRKVGKEEEAATILGHTAEKLKGVGFSAKDLVDAGFKFKD